MKKVLFVCLGNICRSPMAEAIMKHKVSNKNLDNKIYVESCGTSGYHIGERPHPSTRDILDRNNIPFDELIARKLEEDDFSYFDFIVAMDDNNIRDLKYLNPNKKYYKITDFLEDSKVDYVPDPFYDGGFNKVYNILMESCDNLLNYILENDQWLY